LPLPGTRGAALSGVRAVRAPRRDTRRPEPAPASCRLASRTRGSPRQGSLSRRGWQWTAVPPTTSPRVDDSPRPKPAQCSRRAAPPTQRSIQPCAHSIHVGASELPPHPPSFHPRRAGISPGHRARVLTATEFHERVPSSGRSSTNAEVEAFALYRRATARTGQPRRRKSLSSYMRPAAGQARTFGDEGEPRRCKSPRTKVPRRPADTSDAADARGATKRRTQRPPWRDLASAERSCDVSRGSRQHP
jgi:hypothetical protein